MNSYKLYQILCDIAGYAYPDEEYPDNKFTKFFIEVSNKELKSKHGHYQRGMGKRKIVIFNLSRPNEHIITTTIHELAHHIDSCLRGKSDHTKEFYAVHYRLLCTAIGMGIISKDSCLTATDNADPERLDKYFGDIESWDIPEINYKKDSVIIKVFNSFLIKDLLRERGYRYNKNDSSWEKEIPTTIQESELGVVSEWVDPQYIKVIAATDITIEKTLYILVSDCYKHKEYLSQNGYRWQAFNFKKSWNKRISSQNLKSEKSMIEQLDGVKIKVK
ncbi:hypothetical protein [Fictibacillus sp. NRS-1165]|uniref:hypothetical protein n=1 Tax=Fictibacillus sp. NRS-1165 TaxID=3144463 RepID=UPI003D228196